MKKILFALILSGFVTALFAIYQKWSGGHFVPYAFWENRQTYRVTGWYGFPNAVGLFLGPLVPFVLYRIAEKWKDVWQTWSEQYHISRKKFHGTPKHLALLSWYVLCGLCYMTAIVYAKSTGALIGIVAGIGLMALLLKKTRVPAILLGLTAIIGLFLLPTNNPIRQEILAQDRSGQIRVEMWGEATEFLLANPVTGAGLASYQTIIAPYRIDKKIEIFHHPHNIFLTMWMNLGLVGLIGFIWILVWFYRSGLMAWQSDSDAQVRPLLLTILGSMTVVVVSGLVDSPYIKNDLSIFFWFLIALMGVLSSTKQLPRS